MAVVNRLQELRTAGKHELATTLASEILRNESSSVSVVDGRIRVETRTFAGEHELTGSFDPENRESVKAAVERRGTYRLRDPDETMSGFTFTTGCHHDAIVDDLYRAPAVDDDPSLDSELTASAEADERDEVTADRSPAGGSSERVAGAAEPTSFLQQAVAAVQNQFRE